MILMVLQAKRVFLGATIGTILLMLPSQSSQEIRSKETCQSDQKHAAPRYRVAKKYRTDLKPGLVMFVSVAPSEIDRDKLIALACELGRKYLNEDRLSVWILDSYRAARRFHPQGEGNDRQTNLSRRALFGFSRENGDGEQSLEWWPDPIDRNRRVHIDLGDAPRKEAEHRR